MISKTVTRPLGEYPKTPPPPMSPMTAGDMADCYRWSKQYRIPLAKVVWVLFGVRMVDA